MDEILDRAGRALYYAHAALLALFVVNDSEVVFDMDGVKFTGSLAHAAADAGDVATLAGICALLGVVAADKDFCLIVGNDLNQAVGAGLDAGAIRLLGQALTQALQLVHLSRFTTATPLMT